MFDTGLFSRIPYLINMAFKAPECLRQRRQVCLLAMVLLAIISLIGAGWYEPQLFFMTRNQVANGILDRPDPILDRLAEDLVEESPQEKSFVVQLHNPSSEDGFLAKCERRNQKLAECCTTMEGETYSVMDRIVVRSICRLLTPKPEGLSLPVHQNSQQKAYYVTNDLACMDHLGNFMFVAASLIGIGHETGRTALLPEAAFATRNNTPHFQNPFPIEPLLPNQPAAECVSDDLGAGIYNKSLVASLTLDGTGSEDRRVVLRKYLQSWKYFDSISSLIKWHMVFSWPVYGEAAAVLEAKLSDLNSGTGIVPKTIIGVHVRRGDVLRPDNVHFGHVAASDGFILNAVSRLNASYAKSVFVVVSSDPVYCGELLGKFVNVVFVDGNSRAVEMAILTLMDHLIFTVGSYGWWGAYLSNAKEVLYYKFWPRPTSEMEKLYKHEDYFLPHWNAAADVRSST